MKNATAFVTGGAGFIGSELVQQLLAEGGRVVVYDNFSFGERAYVPDDPRVTLVEGDIRDRAALEKSVRAHQPTTVYHLAAIHFIPHCIAHPDDTMDINVGGTQNVADACRHTESVEALVYASSAAVYGVQDTPHTEDDPLDPIEIYGTSKLCGEHIVRLYHKETGVKTASARFFNGFGPRETNPHIIPDILAQLVQGEAELELGNITPERDFIHTRDISRALRAMATGSFDYEVMNVATGVGTSVRQVVNIIAEASGRPLTIRTVNDRVRKVERQRLIGDVTRLRSRLGWEPELTLVDGLRDVVAEFASLSA